MISALKDHEFVSFQCGVTFFDTMDIFYGELDGISG